MLSKHQILLQLALGDNLTDVLEQIDDPHTAARLADHLTEDTDVCPACDTSEIAVYEF